MKAYLALFKNNMRLTLRDRGVLFFNYLFPLIFFFAFAEMFHAGVGAGIAYFVSTVLVMGILGNGLVGRRDAQRAGARSQHSAPFQGDADFAAADPGGGHGQRLAAVPPGALPAGGAGAFSVRHADAAELVLAFPDGVAGRLRAARHRTDSGGGHQYDGRSHHRHPERLHAHAVPQRRHDSGGDAAEMGADAGAIHAGLVPGERLPGNLLPESEPVGQRRRRWPRCC